MADPSPTVSIVVRTYSGRQELLKEALASIDEQAHRPIEVVVVEDGSRESEPAVREFEKASDVGVVYRSAPKRGRCHAGNVGLESTTGRYVSFLDDDDQLYPDHIERLLAVLERDPRAPAAFGRSEVVSTSIRSLRPLDYDEQGRWAYRARAFTRWHLWAENQFPIQACLFRRRLYEQHGGFDERFELLEDWELWARYFSSEEPLAFIDEVTSMFRVPTNASATQRTRAHAAHMANVVAQIRSIEVTVSAGEVPRDATRLLLDVFDDSVWLSKAWSAANRSSWRRGLLLGTLVALVAASDAARAVLHRRRRNSGLSPAAQQLLHDVQHGHEDATQQVTVGEAQILLREEWRAKHRQRYALLALRNLMLHRRPGISGPMASVRRQLGRGARPPYGAVEP